MVLAMGASPVFADVDPDTLCLDPESARAAITERTRAIAPVDFAGHPADMDRLMSLAREHGLLVIEDAAHAIGGRYKKRPVGSLAHLTTFSFHPVKTVTTGEGGAVLTDDPKLAERARDFRNHGLVRDKERLSRHEGSWYYEVQSLGFNYRLTAIQCALGRSQLKRLDAFVARRAQLVARYRRAFASHPRITLMTPSPDVDPGWHLFAIRVSAEARSAVFDRLQRRGIGVQVHYIAVNDLPLYRRLGHDPKATPVAWQASRQLLSLPLFPLMTDADADRVISEVQEALRDEG
jgi:dTDP-4-amino-4,6-dideoxygalactose transaminase